MMTTAGAKYFWNMFYAPLLGPFWKTNRGRTGKISTGCFSIRRNLLILQHICIIFFRKILVPEPCYLFTRLVCKSNNPVKDISVSSPTTFFFVPALLRDCSLCWDHLEVVHMPHTYQALPCGSWADVQLRPSSDINKLHLKGFAIE